MPTSPTAPNRERAINLPTPLLAWIALLALIHAGRTLLPVESDIRILLEAAFVPAPWSIALDVATPDQVVQAAESAAKDGDAAGRVPLARYLAQSTPRAWSVVSYSMLHGSWTHLGFNCLMLVAFGAAVLRRAGVAAALALWLATAAGGAFAHWLLAPLGIDILIGASASVSGFMAAAATFVFSRPEDGRWAFLRNRAALTLLALWIGGNLVLSVIAQPLGLSDGDVAWDAHIGGLIVGLLLFPFLSPGGKTRHRHFTT